MSSAVWKFFDQVKDGKKVTHGICHNCKKKLSSNTFGLKSHLKTAHQIDVDSSSSTTLTQNVESQITEFFPSIQHDSFNATLASLVVEDSISFFAISKSKTLSRLIAKCGLGNVPRSPNTVRTHVFEFADEVKESYKFEISQAKLKTGKLSIAFDEWTSNQNRRFLNLLVYSDTRFWNLGLVRVSGKTNANLLTSQIESRLLEFDLLLTDLVAIMTDGASINLSIAKMTSLFQQLCFAHGVQLAVKSTLYAKSKSQTNIEPAASSSEEEENEIENDELGTLAFVEEENLENFQLKDQNYKCLINKVRETAKIFKKSPVKNDQLQIHVNEDLNQTKQLILDTPTRWNSLIAMLKRFYELRKSINLFLLETNSNNFTLMFSTDEHDQIESIIKTLAPVEELVKVICRSNTSLYETFLAIEITLDKLSIQKTQLSEELKQSLIEKLQQRFSPLFLLQIYLENKRSLEKSKYYDFDTHSTEFKKMVHDSIYQLSDQFENTHFEENLSNDIPADELGDILGSYTSNSSLNDSDMQKSLLDLMESRKVKSTELSSSNNALCKEISYFEQTGNLGPQLSKVLKITKTLRPTTTDSERAFSIAGNFCTNTRTSFRDDTLNNLCILKSYFNFL